MKIATDDNAEIIKSAEDTKKTTSARSTKGTKATKSTKSAAAVKRATSTRSTKSAEGTKKATSTRSTKSAEGTKKATSTGSAKSAEGTKKATSTGSAKSTDSTKSTKRTAKRTTKRTATRKKATTPKPQPSSDRKFADLVLDESIYDELPLAHKVAHLLKDSYGVGWVDGYMDQVQREIPKSITERYSDALAAFENARTVAQAEIILGFMNLLPVLVRTFANRLFMELPVEPQYQDELHSVESIASKLERNNDGEHIRSVMETVRYLPQVRE
ncbi:hypothetical protein [Bifidobacterium dolichotidis]|nr:hypothetical protein [Bifidobacterium dolichotidis]